MRFETCNPDDCGRGMEMGHDTDADGHMHQKVRIACQKCGVVGEWHVDNSLLRAIAAWNEKDVHTAAARVKEMREEAQRRGKEAAAKQRVEMEQTLRTLDAEAKFYDEKVTTMESVASLAKVPEAKADAEQTAKTFRTLAADYRERAEAIRRALAG